MKEQLCLVSVGCWNNIQQKESLLCVSVYYCCWVSFQLFLFYFFFMLLKRLRFPRCCDFFPRLSSEEKKKIFFFINFWIFQYEPRGLKRRENFYTNKKRFFLFFLKRQRRIKKSCVFCLFLQLGTVWSNSCDKNEASLGHMRAKHRTMKQNDWIIINNQPFGTLQLKYFFFRSSFLSALLCPHSLRS